MCALAFEEVCIVWASTVCREMSKCVDEHGQHGNPSYSVVLQWWLMGKKVIPESVIGQQDIFFKCLKSCVFLNV